MKCEDGICPNYPEFKQKVYYLNKVRCYIPAWYICDLCGTHFSYSYKPANGTYFNRYSYTSPKFPENLGMEFYEIENNKLLESKKYYHFCSSECHGNFNNTFFKCKLDIDPIEYTIIGGVYSNYAFSERAKKYKLKLNNIKLMLEANGTSCEICKVKFKYYKDFVIDHCHTTRKVRGLLCAKCNFGLGWFKDSVFSLENAIEYLNKSKQAT